MRSASGGTNRFLQVSQSFNPAPRNFFRTLQTNEPVFAYGLAAKTSFDLNGNFLYADSFDSSIPGRNINGRWNISIRRDRASIAVGTLVTNVSNLAILGSCYLDGAQPISTGPQGAIGSAAWNAAGNHGIQPGHLLTNWAVPHPEVVLPVDSSSWLPMPLPGVVDGAAFNYVFNQPGDYLMPSGALSGKVHVSANARLRVNGSINFTGQGGITIASNAALTIYMNGASAAFGGQGILNPFKPTNFVYFGTAANTSLQVGGNGETTAVFYAPSADITLLGGGASDQDFSGAAIGNSCRLTGHYTFHFDEDLLRHTHLW